MPHTPGPWVVGMRIYGQDSYIVRSGDTQVGIAHGAPNAHMFAAAPDLLGALKEMMRRYQGLDEAATKRGCGDYYANYTLRLAHAAIAKAHGQQQADA